MSHKIRGADELGYLRRQSRFDPLLEAGFVLGDIRLEETESEEVAIPSSAPGLSNEEMKEGFLPEQTRTDQEGTRPSPLFPMPNSAPIPGLDAIEARRTWRELPRHAGLSSVRLRGEYSRSQESRPI